MCYVLRVEIESNLFVPHAHEDNHESCLQILMYYFICWLERLTEIVIIFVRASKPVLADIDIRRASCYPKNFRVAVLRHVVRPGDLLAARVVTPTLSTVIWNVTQVFHVYDTYNLKTD